MFQGTIFKVHVCRSPTKSNFLTLSNFILTRKYYDSIEFKKHFIHRKHVLLLHNSILIYYEGEGDGSVEYPKYIMTVGYEFTHPENFSFRCEGKISR